jgi:hypothetical protein
MAYVERYHLYKQALSLWAATDQCKVCLSYIGVNCHDLFVRLSLIYMAIGYSIVGHSKKRH